MSEKPLLPFDEAERAQPSAEGILECLRMLAQEASALRLADTVEALRTAIAVCAAESEPAVISIRTPPGAMLH